MSYARNLLSRGEEVVYESRQHWFAVVARTIIWILVLIVAVAIVIFLVTGERPFGGETVDGVLTTVGFVGPHRDVGSTSASWCGTGATRNGSSPRAG